MKIETSTGFKCEVDERKFNDYRYIKATAKTNSKNIMTASEGMVELIGLLLGDDTALTEHCTVDGIADINRVAEEVNEIIELMAGNPKIKK